MTNRVVFLSGVERMNPCSTYPLLFLNGDAGWSEGYYNLRHFNSKS